MKIGDPVWKFDVNHRVYKDEEPVNGIHRRTSSFSRLIYREHFRRYVVNGETRVSWLYGATTESIGGVPPKAFGKFPKSDVGKPVRERKRMDMAHSELEVDNFVFVNDHRPAIVEAVRRCGDAALLKRVAEVIGHRWETKES